jgi:protein-disulfide isomerase
VIRKVKNSETNQTQLLIIGGIVGIVVIAIVAFVGLQLFNKPTSFDYSGIHQERTEDGAFILGDPAAPITLVAFEDFLCPHCQNYQAEVHEIFERYVKTGQVRFEFRMLPISQTSYVSFGLAECSEELNPGSFWEAHDTLFRIASTTNFNDASSRTFAQEMGLEYTEVLDCLKTAEQAQVDQTLAGQFEQITGTPSVGWRLNGGPIRFDTISRRPTPGEIGVLVEFVNQQ